MTTRFPRLVAVLSTALAISWPSWAIVQTDGLPPELSEEVAAQIDELDARIEELLRLGLEGDDAALQEALTLAADVLAIRLEHQGPAAGWTDAEGNPAEWYEVGDARRAIDDVRLFASLTVEHRAELAAADDASTDIDRLHGRQRYAEALALAEQQLEIRRRLLGDDHTLTLLAISQVAKELSAAGKFADAEAYNREVFERSTRVFGDEHPFSQQTMNNLGEVLAEQGRLVDAERYLRGSLEGARHLRDEDAVAAIASNLGVTVAYQGRLADAERYLREALDGLIRTRGETDVNTLGVMSSLGAIISQRRKVAEAESLLRRALEISRRVHGEDSLATLRVLNNLGAVLFGSGRLVEGEACWRAALDGYQRVLGPNHPLTLAAMNNMGFLLASLGRLAEAEAYSRAALEASRRLGHEADIALRLLNLGAMIARQGRPVEAEPYFREILERRPGELMALASMGGVLKAQGRLEEAERYYQQALDGRRESKGDDHPETLVSVKSMGILLQAQGRLAEAEVYFREAHDGLLRVVGSDRPQTLNAMARLGRVLQMQGRLDEAQPYLREALAVAERLRTRIVAEERGRAAYAEKLNLSSIAAMLASVLIQMDRPEDAFTVAERGRSRALLDLLARADRDVLEQARRRAEQTGPAAVMAVEEALAAEQEATVDLATAEALVASTRKQRARVHAGDEPDDEKAMQLANLDAQIDRQHEAVGAARRALTNASAGVLIELQGLFPDARPMTIDEIRRDLVPGELVLSYLWTDAFVLLLAAPAHGQGEVEGFVLADSAETIEQLGGLACRLRESIATRPGDPTVAMDSDAAAALFEVLIPEGIRDQVHSAQRLVVLPDGPLHGTPFEVLVSGASADRKLLADEGAQVVYASSATVYLNRRAEAARPSPGVGGAVVLGDPLYEREPLPEPELPDHGVLLTLVTEGSNAAGAGLLRGDVIQSYAGRQVADRAALVSVIGEVNASIGSGQRSGDEPLAVTYWRDGEVGQTTLAPGRLGVQLARVSAADGLRSMAGSSRSLEQRVAESSGVDQVRLFGGRLAALPGTRVEAQQVASILRSSGLDVRTLLGEDATVGRLAEAAEGARFVHLATHGLTGSVERPYDASLALTQPHEVSPQDIGFLSLDDLIRGWRGRLAGCDLVVLSACDTQRGVKHGDSMMALPWGFFYAGAPTVVASLWKVDDTATALLMGRFYENMLGATLMSKADALDEAKRWLRHLNREEADRLTGGLAVAERGPIGRRPTSDAAPRQGRPFAHPFYWAAFVLIGSPE